MKKTRQSASNRLARECMVTALMQLLESQPLSPALKLGIYLGPG